MKLGVVFFTNERTWDLANFSVPYFVENSSDLNLEINILSNKFPPTIEKIPGVNYVDARVEYDPQGRHFARTMLHFLTNCSYDYIFFFSDDFLVQSPIKTKIFNKLINNIQEYSIDKLHLSTLNHLTSYIPNWEQINISDYKLILLDKNYKHSLSTQPSIWKVASLINILNNNLDANLWDLDNGRIKDRFGNLRQLQEDNEFYEDSLYVHYDFKCYGVHKPPLTYHVDERIINSDYFVLDYFEFIRHGKLLESNVNSKKLILEIIEQKSLQNKFKKYI